MTFTPNLDKQERINRFGQTVDLPLFAKEVVEAKPETGLPNWIWNGSQIKAEVYDELKFNLSESRMQVVIALLKLGGSGTDVEIVEVSQMEKSSVNARRNELVKLGVIKSYPGKVQLGKYGKPNTIWYLCYEKLKEIYGYRR